VLLNLKCGLNKARKERSFAPGWTCGRSIISCPKNRYSAFIAGSSALEKLLRSLGRTSIIICGVAADVCVGATTIDAMMPGFKVFFVSDLTANATPERQKVALEVYDGNFAKVVTSAQVIQMLSASQRSD